MRYAACLVVLLSCSAAAQSTQTKDPLRYTPKGEPPPRSVPADSIDPMTGVVMAGGYRAESPSKAAPSPQRDEAAAVTLSCPPPGALFLPTGFTFGALLPDAIYSYNTLAPTIALVEDDIKFLNNVILPKNTRLVGTANTIHTLDRVNINWVLAVLPNGCEFPFSAIAISADDGSAGIKGKVEKHEDSIAAHIMLKSVLSAASVAATAAAPIEGSIASGLSNEGNQALDQSIGKIKSLESIYIHERTPIRVFMLRRFVRNDNK